MGRIGFRYAPSPNSDFVLSYIYNNTDTNEQLKRIDNIDPFFSFESESDSEEKGHQAEAQYLFRADRFSLTAGGSYAGNKIEQKTRVRFTSDNFKFEDVFDSKIRQRTAYAYTNLVFPEDLTWTLGLGYDSFRDDNGLDLNEINPKLGLQWNIFEDLRLRLAAMKTLKRSLVANRTVEPTQVSGFNQFFDDAPGTKARRYGIGLDGRMSENLYTGIEASHRELEVPFPFFDFDGRQSVAFEDLREQLYRGYLYWSPHSQWAFTGEFRFERLKSKDFSNFRRVVSEIETLRLPLSVRYFSSSGFFLGLGAIFGRQEVDRPNFFFDPNDFDSSAENNFVVLDASIGYRLPKRRGIISLEAQNLLDEEFNFQSENIQFGFGVRRNDELIQISRPTNPRFIPDRSIFLRMTLNF